MLCNRNALHITNYLPTCIIMLYGWIQMPTLYGAFSFIRSINGWERRRREEVHR